MRLKVLFFAVIIFFSLPFVQADVDPCQNATVGFYAVRISNGEVLAEQNSGKSLNPASCLKLVTTAAALHILGSDARFETHLEQDGEVDKKGVLRGNIIIRGGGDPCLGSSRLSSSLNWQEQIETWAIAVQNLGISQIEGEVIADASKWENALANPSWCWEDLGNYYGAGASALSFHENTYTLYFRPGKALDSDAEVVRTEPPLAMVKLCSEVKTGPEGSGDRACIFGSEFSPVQYIRGSIPLGPQEFSIKGAIPDPASVCARLLSDALEKKGIKILGKKIPSKNKTIVFHKTISPTIKEIVFGTNRWSHNLYAEHLFKKMGEAVFQEGSFSAGGLAVRQFLQSLQIDLSGFHVVDGSGLSRKNLVTPKQMVELLVRMKKSEFFPQFFESLPEFNDGCRAKTGTMSQVRGFAGYAGDVAFAIFINHGIEASKMNERIEQFILDVSR